ncbi:DUF1641 domain-containing protein [Thermoproteus tenax]|uniref:DUF1641 domain-containing protein n=1 Tax=Thermoproteus tenax (strain ATCC 35583 / DSM 2078 / JCM 9277 / NBRC 100435 / Kra 1) TaxID=768679 RepID=G4RP01_THETK|nr:DUF1641 domain-containing protein [Thermoproteus tenax]CCC81295.1 conserved hypothetical protein [Thermoproteus tenax Kra 1]
MSAEERIFRALSDPQKQEALAALLENIDVIKDLVALLAELKNAGVLEGLAGLLALMRAFSGDLLGRDVAEKAAKMLDLASAFSLLGANVNNVACLSRAVAEADASNPAGIYSLVNSLQDPDVQRGLGYFLSFMKALGKCIRG